MAAVVPEPPPQPERTPQADKCAEAKHHRDSSMPAQQSATAAREREWKNQQHGEGDAKVFPSIRAKG